MIGIVLVIALPEQLKVIVILIVMVVVIVIAVVVGVVVVEVVVRMIVRMIMRLQGLRSHFGSSRLWPDCL